VIQKLNIPRKPTPVPFEQPIPIALYFDDCRQSEATDFATLLETPSTIQAKHASTSLLFATT
jgi:hypothetical protein